MSAPASALTGLTGTVQDASRGALTGALVKVLTARHAVVATTSTDTSGRFAVENLAHGEYVARPSGRHLEHRRARRFITA